MSDGSYNLKSTPNGWFLRNHFLAILFTYLFRVFARNLISKRRHGNIFFILFCWKCVTWGLNRGLMSNKTTHYLFDYGHYIVLYR